MNKKIFAAVFSMALLCSCGNGTVEELSETGAESISLASAGVSETTVTTASAETTSKMISKEMEIVTEVSEAKENVPITRDFFNDDVVFEEVMLPVKIIYYKNDGTVDSTTLYEYDAAGNKSKYQAYTYEYDYNPDGSYNSITTLLNDKTEHISRFDENGYCIEMTSAGTTTNYEYEFDGMERLIRKSEIHGDEKEGVEYTYDETGRLYEEFNNTAYYDYSRFRHKYDGNIENIYYSRDDLEEVLYTILEKDENGNTVKKTIDIGSINNSDYIKGKLFTEYTYDGMSRLIYENHTVSDDYLYEDSKKANVYSYTYEYEGGNLKKETTYNIHKDGEAEYWSNTETNEYFYDKNGRTVKEVYIYDREYDPHDEYPNGYTTEYFYNDDGSIISRTYHTNGTLLNETEYALIPKIKTDIEYKYYNQVNP